MIPIRTCCYSPRVVSSLLTKYIIRTIKLISIVISSWLTRRNMHAADGPPQQRIDTGMYNTDDPLSFAALVVKFDLDRVRTIRLVSFVMFYIFIVCGSCREAKSVSRELLECKERLKGSTDLHTAPIVCYLLLSGPRIWVRRVRAAGKIWAVLSFWSHSRAAIGSERGPSLSAGLGLVTATRGRLRTVMLAWSVRQLVDQIL